MSDRSLSVITGANVRAALEGREDVVLDAVAKAYIALERGQAQTPSTHPLYSHGGRFFAMPGSIDDGEAIIGLKWVASVPGNLAAGAERASALLVVNDRVTGRPVLVVDGTLISAQRTAASAALALRCVTAEKAPRVMALIGCGPINFEVLRFTLHVHAVEEVLLADLDHLRAEDFARRVQEHFPSVVARPATPGELWERADVVSIATNATTPHIALLPARPVVVLHVSLRDIAPEAIAGCYNIVDVAEHAFTARTSLHLAAEQTGRRDLVNATIPSLLAGTARYEPAPVPTVVSPFGLSILDLAVLREVLARSHLLTNAIRVDDFGGTVLT